jgi:hypothetical protein
MTQNDNEKQNNFISKTKASLVEIAEQFAESGIGDKESNTQNLFQRFHEKEFEFLDPETLKNISCITVKFGQHELSSKRLDSYSYQHSSNITNAIERICIENILNRGNIEPSYKELFDEPISEELLTLDYSGEFESYNFTEYESSRKLSIRLSSYS